MINCNLLAKISPSVATSVGICQQVGCFYGVPCELSELTGIQCDVDINKMAIPFLDAIACLNIIF